MLGLRKPPMADLAWQILLAGAGIAHMVVEERVVALAIAIAERIAWRPPMTTRASGPSLLGF